MDTADFDFTAIVNAHSDSAKHKSLAEVIDITAARSIGQKSIPYGAKEKALKANLNRAIIATVIFASLVSTAIGIKITQDRTTVDGVKIEKRVRDEIDDKIDAYYQMMNHTSKDDSTKIESTHRYNEANREANVSYHAGNLVRDVAEAAKVDEVEVRCALLAAFRVINAPYRDKYFSIMLSSISSEEEFAEVASQYDFLDVGSSEEFLAALGYKDWDEYNAKERKEIKKVSQLSQITNRGSR